MDPRCAEPAAEERRARARLTPGRLTPRRPARRGRLPLLLLAAFALLARPAAAQYLTRPHLDWRTLETEHFVFHFPQAMERWTRDVAERMEAVHEAVTRFVGHAPERRVTVLVEDPSNLSNGFALPFRGAPTIFLWPTPPDPSSALANHRGWGELLAVHEFAHVAHLVRPSRNPAQRLLWRLLPVDVGPIARRAPRWLIEGYATYVEGRLTGSGRPAGVGRAAILRQWALEGQLPTYAELDGSPRYLGGSMAYLAGSAFLEWLVEREGEESLTNLWRRMTARADRGFVEAFGGVYGAAPAELYGRFTAELTGRALAIEDSLDQRAQGEDSLVQRLTSATGAPAVSPDGRLVALVLRSPSEPSRLVVLPTEADTAAARLAERARARQRRMDPEDVPAVQRRPAPRRPLHTLHPVEGRGHDHPRFLPDGRGLLVVRSVPQGDGTERPDLFVWNYADGGLRRVTRGAAIREADPSPDGTRAAGVRCEGGICDLVSVDLASGAVDLLVAGSPGRSFYRPRWSPDGRSILVAVQERGRWRLALVPRDGGPMRDVGPDDGASRFGADFLPGGTAVVTTSEAGGIAHLERLDLATGEVRPLTRTTGAHLGVDVAAGGDAAYFLALHARGYDLRRVPPDAVLDGPVAAFGPPFVPAVPPVDTTAAVVDSFPRQPLGPDRPYGLGPRQRRIVPGVVLAPEGLSAQLALHGTDPVGRFAWLLQGSAGERGTWQGAALAAELRTQRPTLRADLFAARHRPATGDERDVTRAAVGRALDADYAGGNVAATIARQFGSAGFAARVGVSAGQIEPDSTPTGAPDDRTTRALAHLGFAGALRWQRDQAALTQGLRLRAAGGRTDGAAWTRAVATYEAAVRWRGRELRGEASAGVTNQTAPLYERFAVGGTPSPLLPAGVLDQRWTMPALPAATAVGTRLFAFRAETDLLGLVAYAWGASAGDSFDEPWHRVLGLERELALPPIAFAAVPATRIRGGVAHSLDEPFADRTRLYLSVTFQP